MEDNPSIVAVYFKQIEGYTHTYLPNQNYYLMDKSNMYPNNRYMLNLQASLWKREELINLIKNDDSPWSFEEEGAARVRSGSIFLCSRNGTHTDMNGCVFPYLTDRKTGYGIWAGKWLWNNNMLLKKNGISVPSISMEHFTRIDMVKYLLKRFKEKLKEVRNN